MTPEFANDRMGTLSRGLMKLRPMTFSYKQDPNSERQYGLIAEEVARVYPELAAYGPDGQIQTVRYQELIPMLLNEPQKQAWQIAQLQISQARQMQALQAQLAVLEKMQQRNNSGRLLAQAGGN
jgi:trimeric autotransporter adhesin